MIYDTVGNVARYRAAIPNFEAVSGFLASGIGALTDGRHEIDGDRVFATISSYGTKRLEDGVFEAHSRYADIQILLDGEELCGVVPGAGWLKETVAYDAAKDIRFFASPPAFSRLVLSPSLFAFFAPSDAHMPGIATGALGKVRKCVIKTLL